MSKPFEPGGVVATDQCGGATPHATFFVPDKFFPTALRSPDGGYYYHAAENHGCAYWIADITLATYSNAHTDSQGVLHGPRAVVISASAYNLPSSAAFGREEPIVKADCEMYSLNIRIYKRAGETKFKLFKWAEFGGHWTAQDVCDIDRVKGEGLQYRPHIDAAAPNVGLDVYRVAVRAILRDSAQRVQVKIDNPEQR